MKVRLIAILLAMLNLATPLFSNVDIPDSFAELPVLYNGRYRPAEAAARLWLAEFSGKQSLPDESALSLAWRVHVLGHEAADTIPLFTLQSGKLKTDLGLDTKRHLFSFEELKHVLEVKSDHSSELLDLQAKLETWQKLGSTLPQLTKLQTQAVEQMQARGLEPAQIQRNLQQQLPVQSLLKETGQLFLLLPIRTDSADWVSPAAFLLPTYNVQKNRLEPVSNFTPYSSEQFKSLKDRYLSARDATTRGQGVGTHLAQFAQEANHAIHSLSNPLSDLPSINQLRAERWYYQWHPCLWLLGLYALSALFFVLHRKTALYLLLVTFLGHTALLALRSYILGRPPVSNMFETVVYVPWIGVLSALLLSLKQGHISSILLGSASLLTVFLLALVETTQLQSGMEPLQPVLDSQYWLIIHVLMVVASYGVFLLAGVLGHVYLAKAAWNQPAQRDGPPLGQSILHCLYLGTGLLIPGTILGGVWAAQSWGRFWDWDPKESWAFISSCVYLIIIHAHTFRHIQSKGLAVGSIIGLWAISFTWYGVNYVLGTGLHSYGFGSGGTVYYFGFLFADAMFLLIALFFIHYQKTEKFAKN